MEHSNSVLFSWAPLLDRINPVIIAVKNEKNQGPLPIMQNPGEV
jgi:hypothetical protein